jgi:penicillin-binding protein 2
LQLANYAATIANRGNRMKATLVHEVRDYSLKNVVDSHEPRVAFDIEAAPEHFETVVDGMVQASRPGGTASATFGWYPIDVASKTGTPETDALPNSTFIAFAPAINPQVAVAVVIEKGWHGYTGAPVAKDIFDAWFGFDAASQEPAVSSPESLPESEAAEELSSQSGEEAVPAIGR